MNKTEILNELVKERISLIDATEKLGFSDTTDTLGLLADESLSTRTGCEETVASTGAAWGPIIEGSIVLQHSYEDSIPHHFVYQIMERFHFLHVSIEEPYYEFFDNILFSKFITHVFEKHQIDVTSSVNDNGRKDKTLWGIFFSLFGHTYVIEVTSIFEPFRSKPTHEIFIWKLWNKTLLKEKDAC